MCVLSHSVISISLQRARLLCPWDSPGKNIGVGGHALLQGIFLTQGSNPHLLSTSPKSPASARRFFITSATWEALIKLSFHWSIFFYWLLDIEWWICITQRLRLVLLFSFYRWRGSRPGGLAITQAPSVGVALDWELHREVQRLCCSYHISGEGGLVNSCKKPTFSFTTCLL